jgi:hypothetical protein
MFGKLGLQVKQPDLVSQVLQAYAQRWKVSPDFLQALLARNGFSDDECSYGVCSRPQRPLQAGWLAVLEWGLLLGQVRRVGIWQAQVGRVELAKTAN